MRRIIVGRGGFAPPKAQKSHIKHELDADLSTSGTRTSSPLVSTKYCLLSTFVIVSLSRYKYMNNFLIYQIFYELFFIIL